VLIGSQVLQLRHQDLTLLTESAGDERDLDAVGRVFGHGRPCSDGLVIGMGMNEEQAAIGGGHNIRLLATRDAAHGPGLSGTISR